MAKRKLPPRWFKTPFNHVEYTICISQVDLDDTMWRANLGGMPFIDSTDAYAHVTFFDRQCASTAAIVQMNPSVVDPNEIASLLAHEAVHIFRKMCRLMGETEPSEEFEAYCIQQITVNLLNLRRDILDYYGSIRK